MKARGLRSVREWRSLLADPASAARQRLAELYPDAAETERRLPLWLEALDGFAAAFPADAEVLLARAPGRVNLLGMHIDHRGGAVNAMAVGDTILAAAPRADDRVVLRNADARYPAREFSIGAELPAGRIEDWDAWTIARHAERVARGEAADWSNYVRAAVLYLQHVHTRADGARAVRLGGMDLFVTGNLQAASGLSSSSAIVVACMEAASRLDGLGHSGEEIAEMCRLAEWYVGTRGGGGDHAAIRFGRRGRLTHIGAFPLTVEHLPFPEGHCAVLAGSLVEAAKTAGARNAFNQRVACYELGLLLLRKRFPERAARMEHLRDVNPAALGAGEGEIYRMLKALPEAASREELSALLAGEPTELARIWRSHEPGEAQGSPDGRGYRVRQVCLYGVAECLRSERAVELLRAGDVAGFGELVTLSHDGDRVTRRAPNGGREALPKPLPDEALERLAADVEGGDAARRERARLWRQPGGYDVSCPEMDEMVDIALEVPGTLGAGLVGAGLGGCIVVLTRTENAAAVIAALEERYYRPRALESAAQVCLALGGAGVLEPD